MSTTDTNDVAAAAAAAAAHATKKAARKKKRAEQEEEDASSGKKKPNGDMDAKQQKKRAKKAAAAVEAAAVLPEVPAVVKKKIGRPRKLPLPDGAPPPPKKKYQRKKPLGEEPPPSRRGRAAEEEAAAAPPLPPGPPPLELLQQRRAHHREQWLATLLAATNQEEASSSSSSSDTDALRLLARHLERGAYNHALAAARRRRLLVHPGCPVFWRLYVARTCALWRNLRSCPALMHSVRVGALTPQELEAMSTMQLDLGHWRAELEAKSKRDGCRFATRLVANTTEYTCRACGSTRCSYFEIQLRKADEPSDVFITCIDCSFRWKDDM